MDGKALLVLVVALLALAAVGRAYPPPGQLVGVSSHRLHIYRIGEGCPTVIFEAANLGMSAHRVRVQRQAARTTRVCAYDRAELGWSQAGAKPQDARQISSELHTLLKNANIEGPCVPVGHSCGGLYAARYPEGVGHKTTSLN